MAPRISTGSRVVREKSPDSKTELIKFRVTPAEKARIVTAAGGARQVSAYLRDLALRGHADGVGEQATEDSESDVLLPVSQPSAKAGLPPSVQGKRIKAVVIDEVKQQGNVKRGEQCPRWMHHRSGTYCGSCKTVPK